MSKLQINDDGTITLPLRVSETNPSTEITLPEPSLAQLAQMMEFVDAADKSVPNVDQLTAGADSAAIATATEQLRERTLAIYSSGAPYGQAVVEIVKLLTGQEITFADLPGWAASPKTTRTILGHFQDPLAGEV